MLIWCVLLTSASVISHLSITDDIPGTAEDFYVLFDLHHYGEDAVSKYKQELDDGTLDIWAACLLCKLDSDIEMDEVTPFLYCVNYEG